MKDRKLSLIPVVSQRTHSWRSWNKKVAPSCRVSDVSLLHKTAFCCNFFMSFAFGCRWQCLQVAQDSSKMIVIIPGILESLRKNTHFLNVSNPAQFLQFTGRKKGIRVLRIFLVLFHLKNVLQGRVKLPAVKTLKNVDFVKQLFCTIVLYFCTNNQHCL